MLNADYCICIKHYRSSEKTVHCKLKTIRKCSHWRSGLSFEGKPGFTYAKRMGMGLQAKEIGILLSSVVGSPGTNSLCIPRDNYVVEESEVMCRFSPVGD